jgi:transcriptional regulator with XRE-family HTH domain
MSELGKRLREIRQLKGWSLKRLADEAEVSPAYVQKLEQGHVASPSPHKLQSIAEALNAPYFELMRLAGYATADAEASEGDAAVRVLAKALQVEDLTAEELEDLGGYLRFRRQQRPRS